jgi:hypothetical protein
MRARRGAKVFRHPPQTAECAVLIPSAAQHGERDQGARDSATHVGESVGGKLGQDEAAGHHRDPTSTRSRESSQRNTVQIHRATADFYQGPWRSRSAAPRRGHSPCPDADAVALPTHPLDFIEPAVD